MVPASTTPRPHVRMRISANVARDASSQMALVPAQDLLRLAFAGDAARALFAGLAEHSTVTLDRALTRIDSLLVTVALGYWMEVLWRAG